MLTVALLIGCNGGTGVEAQKESSHLRALVSFYNSVTNARGVIPQTEEQLKSFIEVKGMQALERLNIPSVDALFVSERDGQPFVVFYGSRPRGVRPDVVAYEQSGVDGVRQVAFSLGMIEDVEEAEFQKMVPEGVQTP